MPSQTLPTPQTPPKFYIPTIDISPYLTSPSSAASTKIIDQVRTACETTGFFQITGHGIPRELQDEVFAGSARLFALSMDEKKKLDKSKSVGASNRGYEIIGNQGLQEGTLPDLKEGFYIGRDIPSTDPRVQNNAFLLGPNQWPSPSLIPFPLFRHPMERYYTKILSLSLTILDILAATLPYGPNVFKDFTSNDPIANIRLLHYPPDLSNDERQLGAGAHTDFGAITLLLQDEIGGLQVRDDGGKWVDVPPNREAYVVNVGDMLEMWTRGRYRSGVHRVVNRSGRDRYSVPFFFDGCGECVLAPLDGGEVEGGEKALTVEGHMRERFGSTYGRGREEGVVVGE
ncbi:Clavaminate synthase-like protein [Glarea lozoyensis ATCC 20868]|uniref:Clavaminate synthase-like protein n=1 Tax=Glarea lozoyensis (strain ATCC 20868 / MF5171) TaxID=1116229 RepID=S3DR23_GLAL2|nr:Clavaminate synthase-like protein [Glarea lozoyensis ATCC 20868]EPE28913.1 Clavaminate synthase-like protein [Glarea lozoyensis ATCC 20868]